MFYPFYSPKFGLEFSNGIGWMIDGAIGISNGFCAKATLLLVYLLSFVFLDISSVFFSSLLTSKLFSDLSSFDAISSWFSYIVALSVSWFA